MEQHYLHQIFGPEQYTDDELLRIITSFKKVTFAKNDYLLEAGQQATDYWFMETGVARSYTINTLGDDISTNFFTSGDIAIDWTSFFLRIPSREYIQALTDCVCWQLDFTTFQQLFHSIERFREEGRTRLVESYFALKHRSVAIIADTATDRYKELLRYKPEIFQLVPLKHLATYLGITDTSLSRIRRETAKAL